MPAAQLDVLVAHPLPAAGDAPAARERHAADAVAGAPGAAQGQAGGQMTSGETSGGGRVIMSVRRNKNLVVRI